MERATAAWTLDFDEEPEWVASFVQKLKRAYVTYGLMVLLPSSAYDDLARRKIEPDALNADLRRLYTLIALRLKITHIAVSRPIPLQDYAQDVENIIRAPRNFEPLYGNFGPPTCNEPPTQEDFDTAFWVTAKQNGIHQTWAPRWTMFSRGNINEKARLLTMPTVLSVVDEGELDGRGSTAVDLYAGIGYFAFSYLKAGVRKVLCWDLNPWSIEGLVRGAAANKWKVKRPTDGETFDAAVGEERLLVFNEDNAIASGRIKQARDLLPPIRHVNCGLLPTSRGSWETAVDVLDTNVGGWIHVHENYAVHEIGQKAEELRQEFQRLAEQRRRRAGYEGNIGLQPVVIDHINRLKSYAPGVMHYVVDVYIPPLMPS